MKLFIIAASAAAIVTSTPAYAADAVGEIALTATVTGACGVGNQRSGTNVDPGYSQDDITVTLADQNGQFSGQEFKQRSVGNVWCNGPATVTLTASALRSTTPVTDTGSFTNSFDLELSGGALAYVGKDYRTYVMTTRGATGGVASESANLTGAFETGTQKFSSFESIRVLKDATNRRPVAGKYSGYIRFTATAAS